MTHEATDRFPKGTARARMASFSIILLSAYCEVHGRDEGIKDDKCSLALRKLTFPRFPSFCPGTPEARVKSIREQWDTNRKDRVWI